ncbi:MAG: 3-hydroxyacyl-CoA dehydrogenase NAD-binding domain-containing protein [Alphaproteobacteria bacterium]|jgi:3-hydroxyacyl-CoA dehydrogenase
MSEELVRLSKQGAIGIITVDNPPVNALSPGVPEGILNGVQTFNADDSVKAIVLFGAKGKFIAGADIRFFGKERAKLPMRPQDALEQSAKPVVAAIAGFALGGGYEMSLGCHYRVALASAKVGLPEITLGLLPGGGGTQRLPRLIGPAKALDLIVAGRHVPAPEALTLGMIDHVFDAGADLLAEAVKYAEGKADARPIPRVRDMSDKLAEGTPELFAAKRKEIARRARNQEAPYANIEAVETACKTQIDEGLAWEGAKLKYLENTDESRALRYAFFAERAAQKLPDVPAGTPVKEIKTAAVIGCGTMGGGIAMCFADVGIPVKVLEATQEALDRGMAKIRSNYEVSVKRGSLAADEMERRFACIEPVTEYSAIAQQDVVIEAVFENMDVKKEIFTQLDATMKQGALILSNTSALDIDEIASVTKRPQDIAGAHFFSPANVMKLLEVVKGSKSSGTTVASTMALGKLIAKAPAACGNCDGFLANRSRAPFNSEMVILLEEGCLPQQVDKVMIDFGYPMGPFAVGDLAGLDIGYAGRARRAAADPNYRTLPIADKLYEMGHYGQKTGAGWFKYEKGDRTPHAHDVVETLIKEHMAANNIEPRQISDDEILKRLLFSSLNEACKILDEGIAYRASDVDIMWLYGFGFPRYRGGLMFWADLMGGPQEAYNQIASWHQRYGDRWAPSEYLRKLAESGTKFADAKGAAG